MKNAEWMIKQGYKFRELTCKCSKTGNCDYDILLNNKCVGKVKDSYSNEAITTWLDMEHNELILDDAEKRYLKGVIRPFRDRIKYIGKTGDATAECIYMQVDSEIFYMPDFNIGTMYKGMELDHEYTLKELGL